MRGIHRSPVDSLTKTSDAEFHVFFDLRLNKRLSKQSRRWWFEAPPWSLWRHCNIKFLSLVCFVIIVLYPFFSYIEPFCNRNSTDDVRIRPTPPQFKYVIASLHGRVIITSYGRLSGNGLSPILRHTITRTKADLLWNGPAGTYFSRNKLLHVAANRVWSLADTKSPFVRSQNNCLLKMADETNLVWPKLC